MGHGPAANLLIVERDSGAVYYAKWRLQDGTQIKRRIGAAWLDRGRGGGRGPGGVVGRRTGS